MEASELAGSPSTVKLTTKATKDMFPSDVAALRDVVSIRYVFKLVFDQANTIAYQVPPQTML